MSEDLTGRLLVATPEIAEGVFRRSVILLLHHGDDGAQGIILNRPLDTEVSAILPSWGAVAVRDRHVYLGGPVGTDSALGVALVPEGVTAGASLTRLYGEVGLVDLDADPASLESLSGAVRVFVGYAGWAPKQLEGEITSGTWYVVDRTVGDIHTRSALGLWSAVLARQPGALALVASFPDDPSMN
jgi:putative transcriptional regulator